MKFIINNPSKIIKEWYPKNDNPLVDQPHPINPHFKPYNKRVDQVVCLELKNKLSQK